MNIAISDDFIRDAKKLSEQDSKMVYKKIERLRSEQYQTEKVKGKENLYRTRINDSIRIFWRYENSHTITILHVGHHDIEKRRRLGRM